MRVAVVPGADAVKVVKSAMARAKSSAATLLLIGMGLAACDMGGSSVERWYSQEQVVRGAKVFVNNCASCHGKQAEGTVKDWKARQPDGSFPPPPLNGTAHAWHHPLPLLVEIIQKGGALYDGKMPGFNNSLSEEDQYAVVAWFQSLWSDDIYRLWQEGNKPSVIQTPEQLNSSG